MAVTWLLWVGACLAVGTLLLTVRNLRVLVAPPLGRSRRSVSVLIPARDEAANIGAALDAVLANRDARFEVLVLDDHSSDATATIVTEIAARDRRVRLLHGRPLEAGQWGKPFACAQLAAAASGDVLLFMDADVRLTRDAIARIAAALEASGAALLSGVPRQRMESFGERLIVPLIHFVLLGFLPLDAMRRSTHAGFGAACGQLLAVMRSPYLEAGGHAALTGKVHDGIALARALRSAGHGTDLADFTPVASCRMYRGFTAVVNGFAKNAHEGLGSKAGILPWSLVLLLGQAGWLFWLPWLDRAWLVPVLVAATASLATRYLLARRFRHRIRDVALHAVGIAVLVSIQWYALARRAFGWPVAWKERTVESGSERPARAADRSSVRGLARR